jgi:regulator of sirC expression with transglutaminase-like and TPR domain
MKQNQQRALLDLLRDGDAETISLVKQELVEGGPNRLPEYHTLLDQCTDTVSEHLREVIERIEMAQNLGNISRGLARLKTFEHLENLCWDLAQAEQGNGFDGGPYARQLDSWAISLRAYIAKGSTVQEQVRAITRYLAHEQRLTGNHTDYYHPRNCMLPWVIEFRQGLPLTLTLVYILVGRRAGLEIEGISAPGHFLARLGPVVFDPYYNGRIITAEEWNRITAEVAPEHRHLLHKACSPVQMMHRLLINLRNAYIKRNDTMRQQRVDHYLAVLQH